MQYSEFVPYIDELFFRLLTDGVITPEQFASSKQAIYESESLTTINEFLSVQQASSVSPDSGQFYAPLALIFVPAHNLLVVEKSDQPMEFVEHNIDYIFLQNGKKIKFPSESRGAMSTAATLFYTEIDEVAQLLSILPLRFPPSDWGYQVYSISESGEKIRIT